MFSGGMKWNIGVKQVNFMLAENAQCSDFMKQIYKDSKKVCSSRVEISVL